MRIPTVALSLGLSLGLSLALAGCGIVYNSPTVSQGSGGDSNKVRVIEMRADTVMVANRTPYEPRELPAIFSQTAGVGSGLRTAGADLPDQVFDQNARMPLEVRVPPAANPGPYTIGVGDVVVLATPKTGSTVEQLSGLLAAQNARQGYTVQDDGSIAIPNVGRVRLGGLTLEEAEAALFQSLVQNQIDPTFSIEIAEFNSKKVYIGGAVGSSRVVPITLTPLYLDEALNQAGGVQALANAYASVRIYRQGTLYQIPLNNLYSDESLQRIQLIDGDSIFVDTAYNLELAQSYFQEQIARANFRQSARGAALSQLSTEIGIRRAALGEARSNFESQVQQDAVTRDYVYLAGEVKSQTRYTLPYGRQATLADALFSNGGIPSNTANAKQIYVLRGSDDPREFGSVTAWNLNIANAGNLLLATRFELRPNDVVFIAEQPVTRWNRVINQITPTIINQAAAAAN